MTNLPRWKVDSILGPDVMAPLCERMGDPDYSGVVAMLGPDYRLCVSADAKRYALQQRVSASAWVAAGGKSPHALAGIVAKYGATVPGLSELAASLPVNPADALPDFVRRVRARDSYLVATDWRRGDYCRVVGRSGNLRLAVSPCGQEYLLQWRSSLIVESKNTDGWRVLMGRPDALPLWEYLVDALAPYDHESGQRLRGESRDDALGQIWADCFAALPDNAADGQWPAFV